ncbi:MAG: gamma-glutamyltransferase family protein [Salinarimonas sp.]|nr:gamma-glutamyltransferase family protein [Salinarimonas sp.]
MNRDFQRPGRSAVYGTQAMIATSHPQASLVGVEVMRKGGSAVDAAIAATAMLGVVEPAMTGIGGDCFAIIAKPGATPVTINGSGRAPAGSDRAALADQGLTEIPDNSPHAVTIPGAVDAWCRLHADYGKLDLAELLEPAARVAEEGYVIAPRVAFDWQTHAKRLARNPATAEVFLPGGAPPALGSRHAQPALAASLRLIGRKGRAGFYEGEVAEDIVATLKALGGVHNLDDFAAQASDYLAPISGRYKGLDILECPPNGQGATALLILAALETWDVWTGCTDPGERMRIFLEATRAAYFLRDRGITDPAFMQIGIEDFLGQAAIDFVRREAMRPAAEARAAHAGRSLGPAPWETDTICLSVVDPDGLVVSFINSIFHPFGSTLLAPKSGVMLHCRGQSFSLRADHPNRLEPGKRPMHTIIPGLVMQGDKPVLPFGVMGGQYQSGGHAHLMMRLYEEGMPLQEAIDAPRAFAYRGETQVEAGIDAGVAEYLAANGCAVTHLDAPLGGAQAIGIDHDNGTLIGASDPRKDGCALGW